MSLHINLEGSNGWRGGGWLITFVLQAHCEDVSDDASHDEEIEGSMVDDVPEEDSEEGFRFLVLLKLSFHSDDHPLKLQPRRLLLSEEYVRLLTLLRLSEPQEDDSDEEVDQEEGADEHEDDVE